MIISYWLRSTIHLASSVSHFFFIFFSFFELCGKEKKIYIVYALRRKNYVIVDSIYEFRDYQNINCYSVV